MTNLLAAVLDYAALGWRCFPCSPANKRPLVEHGLKAATTDPDQIRTWWDRWPKAMIGVACGPESGIVVVDLDVDAGKGLDGEKALSRLLAGKVIPPTLSQHTPRGGRHLIFHYPHDETIRNSASKLGPGIDVRGAGGYIIVAPSVNADGGRYEWETEGFVLYDPPAGLLDPPAKPNGGEKTPDNIWSFRSDNIRSTELDRRSAWADAALKGEADEIALAREGSRNHQLFKSAARLFRIANGGGLSESDVRGALHSAARACGLDDAEIAATIDSAFTATKGESAQPPERGSNRDYYPGSKSAEPPAAEPVPALGEWDAGADDWDIPPRGWLLGNVFCRSFVSSTIAEGGSGKTAVRIAQALALATTRELTGEHVFTRARVLLVSLEDGRHELRRRVRAAMLHHNITNEDVAGWLYLAVPGPEVGKLVVLDPRGRPVDGGFAAVVLDTVKRRGIDIVILDPLIKTHRVPENDNGAMDVVIEKLAGLAIDLDIAVDIPHHVGKALTSEPGNANRGRGASAVKDGGRLVYTLTPMSQEEATTFEIPEGERRLYVRMDSAKVNITPPMQKAKWFRLVGVSLENPSDIYPAGDNVQAAEPWTPPDAWAGLDTALLNRILTDIDAGLEDGNRYSPAAAAGDREAWTVIQRHAATKSELQCRRIIREWLLSGLLVEQDYRNPQTRRMVKGLSVVDAKRPGRRCE